MSSQNLSLSLDELIKVLVEKDSPLLDYLSNGISEAYIKNLIEPVNLIFPEELYTYYEWKNGFTNKPGEVISMGSVALFTLGNPIPLETAFEVYFTYSFINNYWPKNYFPIFESGIGDHFLFDLDENSPTYRMIMFFSPSNPYFQGVISFSDSLVSLIDTIKECYEKNIYYFERFEGGRVFGELPDSTFVIWKQNNPKSEYWKRIEEFS